MSSITTIPGLPAFATPSEHNQLTQTTPSTFDALPPVLRCRVEHVLLTLSGIEGRPEWVGIKATLLLTEREVAFYVEERGESLIVPYKAISLHALSRAEGQPGSIYCQLDEALEQAEQPETEEDVSSPELLIVPDDPTTLDQIFEVLSMCASLHPSGLPADPNDDDGFVFDGDQAGGEGEGEGEGEELSSLGRNHTSNLTRLDALLDRPPIPTPLSNGASGHDSSQEDVDDRPTET